MKIEWEGDLIDECVARYEGMIAHCENLGDVVAVRDCEGEDPEAFRIGQWWAAVSLDGGGDIFNTSDSGGVFTTGELARAACEAIMEAIRSPASAAKGVGDE